MSYYNLISIVFAHINKHHRFCTQELQFEFIELLKVLQEEKQGQTTLFNFISPPYVNSLLAYGQREINPRGWGGLGHWRAHRFREP